MYAVLLEDIKNPHYATINPLTMKTIKSPEIIFYAGDLVDLSLFWQEPDKCNVEDVFNPPKKFVRNLPTPRHVTISLTDYSKHERMFKLLYG